MSKATGPVIEIARAALLGAAIGLGASFLLTGGIAGIFLVTQALGFNILSHTHESPIICGTGLTCTYDGDGGVLVEGQGTPG